MYGDQLGVGGSVIILLCMQLHRLHKNLTDAPTVFTKSFEMGYPVLKEVGSP